MDPKTALVFTIVGVVIAVVIYGLLYGLKLRINMEGVEISIEGYMNDRNKARESKNLPAAPPDERLTQEIKTAVAERKDLPVGMVLWIDNHPINNLYERHAFARLGIFCDSFTSNREAQVALGVDSYDVIVSNIGRDDKSESGWELLDFVKRSKPTIPFVIYTSGIDDQARQQAQQRGALAITEDPDELTKAVFAGLYRADLRRKEAQLNKSSPSVAR